MEDLGIDLYGLWAMENQRPSSTYGPNFSEFVEHFLRLNPEYARLMATEDRQRYLETMAYWYVMTAEQRRIKEIFSASLFSEGGKKAVTVVYDEGKIVEVLEKEPQIRRVLEENFSLSLSVECGDMETLERLAAYAAERGGTLSALQNISDQFPASNIEVKMQRGATTAGADDILILISAENPLTAGDAGRMNAGFVIEAEEGAILPEAAQVLADRHAEVLPEVVIGAVPLLLSYHGMTAAKSAVRTPGKFADHALREIRGMVWSAATAARQKASELGISMGRGAYVTLLERLIQEMGQEDVFRGGPGQSSSQATGRRAPKLLTLLLPVILTAGALFLDSHFGLAGGAAHLSGGLMAGLGSYWANSGSLWAWLSLSMIGIVIGSSQNTTAKKLIVVNLKEALPNLYNTTIVYSNQEMIKRAINESISSHLREIGVEVATSEFGYVDERYPEIRILAKVNGGVSAENIEKAIRGGIEWICKDYIKRQQDKRAMIYFISNMREPPEIAASVKVDVWEPSAFNLREIFLSSLWVFALTALFAWISGQPLDGTVWGGVFDVVAGLSAIGGIVSLVDVLRGFLAYSYGASDAQSDAKAMVGRFKSRTRARVEIKSQEEMDQLGGWGTLALTYAGSQTVYLSNRLLRRPALLPVVLERERHRLLARGGLSSITHGDLAILLFWRPLLLLGIGYKWGHDDSTSGSGGTGGIRRERGLAMVPVTERPSPLIRRIRLMNDNQLREALPRLLSEIPGTVANAESIKDGQERERLLQDALWVLGRLRALERNPGSEEMAALRAAAGALLGKGVVPIYQGLTDGIAAQGGRVILQVEESRFTLTLFRLLRALGVKETAAQKERVRLAKAAEEAYVDGFAYGRWVGMSVEDRLSKPLEIKAAPQATQVVVVTHYAANKHLQQVVRNALARLEAEPAAHLVLTAGDEKVLDSVQGALQVAPDIAERVKFTSNAQGEGGRVSVQALVEELQGLGWAGAGVQFFTDSLDLLEEAAADFAVRVQIFQIITAVSARELKTLQSVMQEIREQALISIQQ